jgi:hypothetical protein
VKGRWAFRVRKGEGPVSGTETFVLMVGWVILFVGVPFFLVYLMFVTFTAVFMGVFRAIFGGG